MQSVSPAHAMPDLALILLAATFFGGCSSPVLQSATQSRRKPERFYIIEAALRYELSKHFADPSERVNYAGYIIDCPEFGQELIAALHGYSPPVLADALATTDTTGREILEKTTGKHTKVWPVRIADLSHNAATAYVFWFSGGSRFGDGSYKVVLKRKNGHWEVLSERIGVAL
jgi:hypothetical protein